MRPGGPEHLIAMTIPMPTSSDAAALVPAVRVEGFRAAYAGRTVLQDLTFDVAACEVFVIAGGCGGGKSTVLKHMIGQYRPADGRILIEEDDLAAASGAARQRLLRKFAVAFQGGALFGDMTVLQNVRLAMEEFTDHQRPPRLLEDRRRQARVGSRPLLA
jgi:phospholipid/cholesterol/gamma-HCH transport system ATP-binding protein